MNANLRESRIQLGIPTPPHGLRQNGAWPYKFRISSQMKDSYALPRKVNTGHIVIVRDCLSTKLAQRGSDYKLRPLHCQRLSFTPWGYT